MRCLCIQILGATWFQVDESHSLESAHPVKTKMHKSAPDHWALQRVDGPQLRRWKILKKTTKQSTSQSIFAACRFAAILADSEKGCRSGMNLNWIRCKRCISSSANRKSLSWHRKGAWKTLPSSSHWSSDIQYVPNRASRIHSFTPTFCNMAI